MLKTKNPARAVGAGVDTRGGEALVQHPCTHKHTLAVSNILPYH